MNTASPNRTDTLFAGRLFTVTHEDGIAEEIKIRQLRLADYERAIVLIDDEMALTAFCCLTVPKSTTDGATTSTPAATVLDKPWIHTLQPESYEVLQLTAQDVNAKGFFAFAARRTEKERRAKEELMKAMAGMPPETIKAVGEMAGSGLKPSAPRPRPIPA